MRPIGYRDLHGTRPSALVLRLERRHVGGFALGLLLAAIFLVMIGFLFGRATAGVGNAPVSASEEPAEAADPEPRSPPLPTEAPPASARDPRAGQRTHIGASQANPARPAALRSLWKPPVEYLFVVGSVVVANDSPAAASATKRRAEAEVSRLRARRLDRAALARVERDGKTIFRIVADARALYSDADADAHAAHLKRKYDFSEVWVLRK